MCGGCWSKKPVSIPVNKPKKAAVRQIPNKDLPAPKDGDVTKFCKRCNWKITKVRYVDSKTNVTIEKYICTNQNCPLHGN